MSDVARPCVLIVDDDERVSQTVALILEFDDFRVKRASRGSVGLEVARAFKPDLILLDLMLPDLPGTDVLRFLKEDEETSDIPVFLFTANEDKADDESIEWSAGIISKPFDAEEMVARLRECLVKENSLLR